MAALVFDTSFNPQTGTPVALGPGIVRVTAPNSSAYTFTGTNTFLLGNDRVAILDPGPEDPQHQAALQIALRGRRVTAILLTHTHRDHSAGAERLARLYKAPIWSGGVHRLSRPLRRGERNPLKQSSDWTLKPDRVLKDGETIDAGDLRILVHATPGHCANHLAFGHGTTLFSGDHVMGWNSTLVAPPDGSMADYLASLDKVLALPYQRYLPAHGGAIADGPAYAAALREHRLQRNEQIIGAVGAGAHTVPAIVRRIYPRQSLQVRMAARMTVSAHVEYLEALGRIRIRRGLFGASIVPIDHG